MKVPEIKVRNLRKIGKRTLRNVCDFGFDDARDAQDVKRTFDEAAREDQVFLSQLFGLCCVLSRERSDPAELVVC